VTIEKAGVLFPCKRSRVPTPPYRDLGLAAGGGLLGATKSAGEFFGDLPLLRRLGSRLFQALRALRFILLPHLLETAQCVSPFVPAIL
jgi:hypothetical protein